MKRRIYLYGVHTTETCLICLLVIPASLDKKTWTAVATIEMAVLFYRISPFRVNLIGLVLRDEYYSLFVKVETVVGR